MSQPMTDDAARLVAFCAEKIMEWTFSHRCPGLPRWVDEGGHIRARAEGEEAFDPLTNDAHAGMLVDRMAVKGFSPHWSIESGVVFTSFEKWVAQEGGPSTMVGGNSHVIVQGDPPTEQDFRAARLLAVTLAAAQARGWEG